MFGISNTSREIGVARLSRATAPAARTRPDPSGSARVLLGDDAAAPQRASGFVAHAQLPEDLVGVLAERGRAAAACARRRGESHGRTERGEPAGAWVIFLDEDPTRAHLGIVRQALEVVDGCAQYVALLESRHPL